MPCDGEEEEKNLRRGISAAEVLGVQCGAGVESRRRIFRRVEGMAWGCYSEAGESSALQFTPDDSVY